LDSDRRDSEFAGDIACIAFLTVSFVPKPILWNPVQKKNKNRSCKQDRVLLADDLFVVVASAAEKVLAGTTVAKRLNYKPKFNGCRYKFMCNMI